MRRSVDAVEQTTSDGRSPDARQDEHTYSAQHIAPPQQWPRVLIGGAVELLIAPLEDANRHPQEPGNEESSKHEQPVRQSQLATGEDNERCRGERRQRSTEQSKPQCQQRTYCEDDHEERLRNQVKGLAAWPVAKPVETPIKPKKADDDEGQAYGDAFKCMK